MPLVGVFIAELAGHLTQKFPQFHFKADMEFSVITEKIKPGNKPSCDGAICAIVASGPKLTPFILYEYKPTVDPRCNDVYYHDLMEVLLQAYYCLHQHKVCTIIHCLTDMSQWYYFRVDEVSVAKLKVTWYKSISEHVPSVQSHVSFLHPVLENILKTSGAQV